MYSISGPGVQTGGQYRCVLFRLDGCPLAICDISLRDPHAEAGGVKEIERIGDVIRGDGIGVQIIDVPYSSQDLDETARREASQETQFMGNVGVFGQRAPRVRQQSQSDNKAQRVCCSAALWDKRQGSPGCAPGRN